MFADTCPEVSSRFDAHGAGFRTGNCTALEAIVFCYRRSFSLSVPFSCLFLLEKKHFSLLSVSFCYRCSEFSPRIECALRRGGSFGQGKGTHPKKPPSPPKPTKTVCANSLLKLLGSVFGRPDFSRIFIFEPPDFVADFVAGFFLLIFVGEKVPRKILQSSPGKSPTKSSKFYTTKIPDNFLQRGQAKNCFCELRT